MVTRWLLHPANTFVFQVARSRKGGGGLSEKQRLFQRSCLDCIDLVTHSSKGFWKGKFSDFQPLK